MERLVDILRISETRWANNGANGTTLYYSGTDESEIIATEWVFLIKDSLKNSQNVIDVVTTLRKLAT